VVRAVAGVATLTLVLVSAVLAPYVGLSAHLFSVEGTTFRSRVGGDVYPGSRGAQLIVEVRYLGTERASSVYACITLPQGFTAYYRCSGARSANDTYVTTVEYGDVVRFTYTVDVSREVPPGSYVATLNITYRVGGSLYWELVSVDLPVTPFPELQLEVRDSYWSPIAYPGTEGTSLYVTLKTGRVGISSATLVLKLPEGFYPRESRSAVGRVDSYSTFTAVFNGIDVDRELAPGSYQAVLEVRAVAVTDDGVQYDTSTTIPVDVAVEVPPRVRVDVVSSGWLEPRVTYGSARATYRVVLRLAEPGATVRSLVATLMLPTCASFPNGSRSSAVYLNTPINYGEVFELQFSGVGVSCYSTEFAELELTLLVTRDGSEFWANTAYRLPLVVQNPTVGLRVVSVFWAPQVAYPGGSSLSLVVVLENFDYASLYGGVATLKSGVLAPTSVSVSGVSVDSFSRQTITFDGLSISRDVRPGTYSATLTLDTLVRFDRATYRATLNYELPLVIDSPPRPLIEVVGYGWLDGRAFSNSTGNTVRVTLRNSDPATVVRGLRLTLGLPECFSIHELDRVYVSSAQLTYGSATTVDFGGIDIACPPGVYVANLTAEVLGDTRGSEFWANTTYRLPLVVGEPVLNIELVDAGWLSRIAYGNSSRLTPYVVLYSYTRDRIESAVVTVTLVNAVLSEGGRTKAVAVNTPLDYGSSQTIRLPLIEVGGVNSVELTLGIRALVRYGRTLYNASRQFHLSLPVVEERNLAVVEVHSEYAGSRAPALPSARGIDLVATLANVRSEAITITGIRVETPGGVVVRGAGGSCVGAPLPGTSTCSLRLTLDLAGNLTPSVYRLRVTLSYAKSIADASLYSTEVVELPLAVEPLEDYAPDVRLLNAYWGVGQPVPVYPNSSYVPLTVTLVNRGRYDAVGVTVRAYSKNITAVVDSGVCSARLPAGSSCTVTLYFNIPGSARGYVGLAVDVEYGLSFSGAYVAFSRSLEVYLYVEEPVGLTSGGLAPVSWGWLNNYNVFPRTDNATYVVTVANRLPYPVQGVLAELQLPEGFRGNAGSRATAYVDGPIRSYAATSIPFRVSVGDVAPGVYRAVLRLDYVVQSGGPGARLVEEYYVELRVVDEGLAFEVVSSGWVEGSVEPGTYGALLHVVIRNNYVDGASGLFLELRLPEGFTSSIDNSSVARVPPLSPQVIQALATGGRQAVGAIAQLLQQAPATATYSRGSILDFVVPLNVLVNTTGTYRAEALLHYVDQWGTPRSCRLGVPIPVLGSVRYISVDLGGGTVRVSSRVTKTTLRVVNYGSSPAYNVYVAVLPYSQLPVLVVSPSVHYIDRVDANSSREVEVTLVYNPMGVYAGVGATTVVSYGTVPLLVTVVFRDVGGRVRSFNNTVAVVVEPFVELALRDARAILSGGALRVSGTLVNYGSATAYRSRAVVCVAQGQRCADTFVGDVESGSQRAFSVSLSPATPVDRVEVVVEYYNVYNELLSVGFPVPVQVAAETTPTKTPEAPLYTAERVAVTLAVVAFLAVVGYLIYRVASGYYRRLKHLGEVPPP
jgi:hypothetical protein